jgi:hypothetical protein
MTHHARPILLTLVILALGLAACGGNGGDGAADEATAPTDAAGAAVLTISADTVSGPLNIPEDQRAGAVCVLQSRFPRNSEIVWRARVMDVQGAELDDAALASVEVRLGDGQTFAMRYGPHPRENPTDFFWTTAFDIPSDYPSGTLGYEIVATANDGATGTFKPFEVAPSLLTITDEVLDVIEEAA